MHARVNDWLVVEGTVLDAPEHYGQILEVHSDNGEPPYLVRWAHNDVEALVFPGPDARVMTPDELELQSRRTQTQIDNVQEMIRAKRNGGS